jgi:hypothetical protein
MHDVPGTGNPNARMAKEVQMEEEEKKEALRLKYRRWAL